MRLDIVCVCVVPTCLFVQHRLHRAVLSTPEVVWAKPAWNEMIEERKRGITKCVPVNIAIISMYHFKTPNALGLPKIIRLCSFVACGFWQQHSTQQAAQWLVNTPRYPRGTDIKRIWLQSLRFKKKFNQLSELFFYPTSSWLNVLYPKLLFWDACWHAKIFEFSERGMEMSRDLEHDWGWFRGALLSLE